MLHVVLSYQKNKIATLKKFYYPPFTPHYDIFWGELNIFEILHWILSYQEANRFTLKPQMNYTACIVLNYNTNSQNCIGNVHISKR